MSSEEGGSPPTPSGSGSQKTKQRRPQRSCDFCRQRKIRCDGPSGAGTKCSNCLAFGVSCTYVDPARKRGPKSKLVEELKQRVGELGQKNAALEAKLRSLSICSLCSRPLQSQSDGHSPPSVFHDIPENCTSPPDADRPSAEEKDELAERFRQISIGGMKGKFFGSASSFALVTSALVVRTSRRNVHSIAHLVQEKEKYLGGPSLVASHSRRRLYWERLPWEMELYEQRSHYVYPPRDLIASLLKLYFAHVHPSLPVLHRPSFEQDVAEGLYLKDSKFGATLLVALALASRYSDDPRVLVDGETTLSAGWKFIAQVQIVRRYFDPTLHEVEFYCLMTMFSLGTSAPQNAWLYIGLGIRFLQHRGEHRRKRDGHKFEEERWNRVFWSFFALDRMVCTFLGRPAAIHIEDYNVEPPLEVDDEYWEHGFTQPLGKPSVLSFFVYFLRLCEILGDTLRRIYASQNLKIRMGWTSTEWDQSTVAELDSRMNDFLDSIPPHLRWDPDRQGVFFNQSAILYATYYYIQITIHRPFIQQQNALAAPSLFICTTAARSALHVADVWLNRVHHLPFLWLQNSVFVSAVILLLNLFGSKRAGLPIDTNKDLAQVETALRLLKLAETWWQPAGRLWELVQELQSLDGSFVRPRNELDLVYCGGPGIIEFLRDTPPPACMRVGEGLGATSGVPNKVYAQAQPGQSFKPGTSIEQLLADATGEDPNIPADDEMMSMWTAAPTDFMNINQWDAYIGTMNGIGNTNGVDMTSWSHPI
ncbi:fungal-specific transcription factor domain-containing protein [Mycena maculata]|uniref:Fungal-specific transcription factor domain-containing protein n=1 Tax=Mycena maculata TaxID=230809 RepID=A0AAD7NFA6_9AGAR|nr:fungal-specific transcription factor domain-containing protein [Mycena maculata]